MSSEIKMFVVFHANIMLLNSNLKQALWSSIKKNQYLEFLDLHQALLLMIIKAEYWVVRYK